MKDDADNVTHELPLPARRGRPTVSGKPMTPAERKKRQRELDKAKVWGGPDNERDLSAASTHALAVEFAKCVEQGRYQASAEVILAELVRRFEASRNKPKCDSHENIITGIFNK